MTAETLPRARNTCDCVQTPKPKMVGIRWERRTHIHKLLQDLCGYKNFATISGWGRTIPWNYKNETEPKNDYQCKLMESKVKLLECSECKESRPNDFDEDINSKIYGF